MIKMAGQYFTTSDVLRRTVAEFILNSPSRILEPSVGKGDLLLRVIERFPSVKFDTFEIDGGLEMIEDVSKSTSSIISHVTDFLTYPITRKYTTIIGNPPYVKIAGKRNLYIDFVEKCFGLLKENGELIFIVPSDFFKLTSTSSLLNEMLEVGTFSHIFHPHNEKLFENAVIDVLVFRYVKDETNRSVLYNEEPRYLINNNGTITFEREERKGELVSELFDVYVGIVSGKEEVFKNEIGNISVINGEDDVSKYIYLESFPSDNEQINRYLLSYKHSLVERRIRKFNENNWYQWGAIRNVDVVRRNIGRECIYVHTLTRKKKVAFRGVVGYFGGGLLMMLPKKECDIDRIINTLNSTSFRENFTFSNRFKIGQRQLLNTTV